MPLFTFDLCINDLGCGYSAELEKELKELEEVQERRTSTLQENIAQVSHVLTFSPLCSPVG